MFPKLVSGDTVHRLNSLYIDTPRLEIHGSDKGDIQNAYCWCASRNRVGKHCSRLQVNSLGQVCSILLQEGHPPVKFSSNPELNAFEQAYQGRTFLADVLELNSNTKQKLNRTVIVQEQGLTPKLLQNYSRQKTSDSQTSSWRHSTHY